MSSNGKFVSKAFREKVYARDGYRCVWCRADTKDKASLDHVIPRSANGSDLPSNLVTCCLSCNSRRQNKDPEVWALSIAGGNFMAALEIIARVCRAMGTAL